MLCINKREIDRWYLVEGERSCYDEGKRTAETLAMDYHRGAGVEVNYPIDCMIASFLA